MIKRYTLENKPILKYGDWVKVDMSFFGSELGIMSGKIVGKSMTHIIDNWLVEFDQDFAPTYPYKVFTVPHVAIVESDK